MSEHFYIVPDGPIDGPKIMECSFMRAVVGELRPRPLLLVQIHPEISGKVIGQHHAISRVLLNFVDPSMSLDDVGTKIVMFDVVVGPDNKIGDMIDERNFRRVAIATAHSTKEAAERWARTCA